MIKEALINQLIALHGGELVDLKGSTLRVMDIEFPLLLDSDGSIMEVRNISKERNILARISFLIGSLEFIQNDLLAAGKEEKGDAAHTLGNLRYATVEALVDFLFLLTRVSSEEELKMHVAGTCTKRAELKSRFQEIALRA